MKFDIAADNAIIAAGGFWCSGCLAAHPAADKSPDGRYCTSCYSFLADESKNFSKRESWMPQTTQNTPPASARRVRRAVNGGGSVLGASVLNVTKKARKKRLNLPVSDIKVLHSQGKSTREIVEELGLPCSHTTIARLLNG